MRRVIGAVMSLGVACATPRPPVPSPEPSPAPVAPPAPSATPAPAPVAEPAPTTTVPPVAEILRDGYADRHRERTMPKRVTGPDYKRERVVVEHADGKVRYVLDAPTHRALVTFAETDMLETPLAVRALTRRAEPAKATGERVLVAPGLPLERVSEQKGYVRVRADRDNVTVQGWLDRADVGTVYVPADVPAGARGTHWMLAPRTKMLASPGGAVIATLGDNTFPRVLVVELNRTPSWFVEVELRQNKLEVRGFVPKNALQDEPGGGYGVGYGRIGRGVKAPAERVVFPAGACLYAEPWGEVIGVLRAPFSAEVHIEDAELAAWREVDLGELAGAWVPRAGATERAPDPAPEPLSLANGFRCEPAPAR